MDLANLRACGDAGPSSAHTEQKERRKQCERPRAARAATRCAPRTREQIIAPHGSCCARGARTPARRRGAAKARRRLRRARRLVAAGGAPPLGPGVAGVREAELLGVLQSLLLQQQEGAAAAAGVAARVLAALVGRRQPDLDALDAGQPPVAAGLRALRPGGAAAAAVAAEAQQPARTGAERGPPARAGGAAAARGASCGAPRRPDDEPAGCERGGSLQHGGTSPRGTVHDDGDLASRLASARWALENPCSSARRQRAARCTRGRGWRWSVHVRSLESSTAADGQRRAARCTTTAADLGARAAESVGLHAVRTLPPGETPCRSSARHVGRPAAPRGALHAVGCARVERDGRRSA